MSFESEKKYYESVVIGKTIPEAVLLLNQYHVYVRTIMKDGQEVNVASNLVSRRMNVSTIDGKIAEVLRWG